MRLAATMLAVLCLTVASGCGGEDGDGGDGGGGGGAGAAPTRAQYIAQGDAVCRRTNSGIAATNARIEQINRTATDARQALSDAAPLLAETAEAQRTSVREFRGLTPPAADTAAVREIVAGIEAQVALVGRVADAAAAADVTRIRELGTELRGTRERVRALLADFGFQECGRASGAS